jgi:hypothetical protein
MDAAQLTPTEKARRSAHSQRLKDPHAAFNKLPADKAVEHLRGVWGARHEPAPVLHRDDPEGQKKRLPLSMPGSTHPDPRVREVAHKVQAHALANSLGDTHDRKSGTPPQKRAQAHVVKNATTGALSVMGQFHGKPRPETPAGHEIVYTAVSEGLARSALLAENLRASIEPSRSPALSGDSDIQKKLRAATPEIAARLKRSLEFREKLRSTKEWPPKESEATTAKLSTAVDPNAKTKIMRPAGHKTQVVRPYGHKTQVVLNTVQQKAPTAVMPAAKVDSLDDTKKGARTQNIRIQENAFMSRFPAGTRISGAPGVQGVTDTSNVGLVSAQGGVVPDKKKRELKIPDMTKLPKGRDPITKQLEKQPSFAGMGNPIFGRLTRTEQALAEATLSDGVWGHGNTGLSGPDGPNRDMPNDDWVGQYESFRLACPDHSKMGHAAFCGRCDNSWPTGVGGANLSAEDIERLRPDGMNPFEVAPDPIPPLKFPKITPYFGKK